MKIQFIGTGSILTGSLSASILIEDRMLIDVPNGFCKQCRNNDVNIQSIDHIFISHFHGDHYFDLPFLLLELGLRIKRSKPLTIYGPKGIESKVKALHAYAFNNWDKVQANAQITFCELEQVTMDIVYNDTSYTVRSIMVDHEGLDAYGFIISDGDKKLGYSGDTQLCDSVHEIVTNSDASILDMSFANSRKGHMGYSDVKELATQYIGKKIFATHMSDEARAIVDERITTPSDFDTIHI